MGIDYSANFGIGYQVKVTNEEIEDQLEYIDDSIIEYDRKIGSKSLLYFEGGDSYCSNTDYYIIIKNPFENDIDGLKDKKEILDNFFLDYPDIEKVSEFDVVGDLHIW